MTDIKLTNMRKPGHGRGVPVIQTMSRMDPKPDPMRLVRRPPEPFEFPPLFPPHRIGISPRMKFNRLSTEPLRHPHLLQLGINEKAHFNPLGLKFRNDTPEFSLIPHHIEPSLRRDLLAPFRHKTGLLWL